LDNNSENNKQPPTVNFVRNMPPFLYVIIVLGIIFFLYQIIGAGLTVAAGGVEFEKNIQITRLVLSFSQFMFILAPTVFFTRLQTPELKKTFRLNLPSPYLLFLAVMGIIFIQPLLQGYMAVQESILNHIPFLSEALKQLKSFFELVEEAMIKLVKAYSPVEFAVVVFVIAVTPAVCEEILFRGFVMKNLEKISKPSIAIFLTGFLFAIYHFEPFSIIPLIALGCFLSFVVYYSNSIYLGIICHFLNNFFASFFLYKYGKEDMETPHFSQSETMDVIITVSVSLILFLAAMFLFFQMRYKEREVEIE
jgi:membrane protease YdiL (CAAX protease family)